MAFKVKELVITNNAATAGPIVLSNVGGALSLNSDFIVNGSFTFGDAATDVLTINGYVLAGASTADYMINLVASTPAIADIILSNSATIANGAAGQLTITETAIDLVGAIKLDGTVTFDDDGTLTDAANLLTITQDTISLAGAVNTTGDLTVNGGDVTIQETDVGDTGAELSLTHVSSSPAAFDEVGIVYGKGYNDNSGAVTYGSLGFGILDPAEGAEIGAFAVSLQNASGGFPTTQQFTINGETGSIGVTREDDGEEGAALTLTQISGTPANGDELGFIKFIGMDTETPQALIEFAQILATITDNTLNAEWGQGRFKALNGTGSLGVAGGWSHDGSYGHLISGDGEGAGYFTSIGDNDVVLATGNPSTGYITITDGADGAITIAPHGAGILDVTSQLRMGEQGTAIPVNTALPFGMEVQTAANASIVYGDTGWSAGVYSRYEILTTPQTNGCMHIGVAGKVRVKADVTAGGLAGVYGLVKISEVGTVISGATSTTAAGQFAIEADSDFELTDGYLNGIVIDSSVHPSATISGTMSAVRIKKSGANINWPTGLEIAGVDLIMSAGTSGTPITTALTTGVKIIDINTETTGASGATRGLYLNHKANGAGTGTGEAIRGRLLCSAATGSMTGVSGGFEFEDTGAISGSATGMTGTMLLNATGQSTGGLYGISACMHFLGTGGVPTDHAILEIRAAGNATGADECLNAISFCSTGTNSGSSGYMIFASDHDPGNAAGSIRVLVDEGGGKVARYIRYWATESTHA